MQYNNQVNFFMVHFDNTRNKQYKILSEVFEKSIKNKMPNANIINKYLNSKELPTLKKIPKNHKYYMSYKCNTLKLKYWNDYVNNYNTNTVLIDCDMLLRNSIDSIFENDFDIGLTVRKKTFNTLNGGVIFIKKPNDNIKEFFNRWYELNNYLLENPKELEYYSRKYLPGINQSSLCLLLENEEQNYNIKYFPCEKWNSCQDSWRKIYRVNSNIVHIKSNLRKEIFKIYNGKIKIKQVEKKYLQPIIKEWFQYI